MRCTVRWNCPIQVLSILATLLLFVFPVSTHGGICIPPVAEKENSYQYILNFIDSLSYAQSAAGYISRLPGSDPDPMINAFDLLLAINQANRELECAQSQVSAYTDSPHRAIKGSAHGIITALSRLVELNEGVANEFAALLDTNPAQVRSGQLLGSLAERAASIDDAWRLLLPAAILATFSVMEEDPSTGLMSGLALTAQQRDQVLGKLRAHFGEEPTKGIQAGQPAVIAAAGAIYEVIGNQPRKVRDR